MSSRAPRRESNADDLAAGQISFRWAGFALDEAAGMRRLRRCTRVVHGEGKKSMAFTVYRRGNGSGQNHGFARGHQCAPEPAWACAGLKDQPRATGKLDGTSCLT